MSTSRSLRTLAALGLLSQAACLGKVTLAPHLSREQDLAPPAAAGRYSTVLERANGFEAQNAASKDVYWYRTWRAVAMLGLGQPAEAAALLDQILSEMTTAKSAPAQPERLRMFVYDLKAQAALAQGDPRSALDFLERAYGLAERVELESDGDCDRHLVLAARLVQQEEVATLAGAVPRAGKAHADMGVEAERWSACKRRQDFVSMVGLPAMVAALAQGARPVAAVVPPTSAPLPPPVALPPAAPPPAAPPPAAPAPVAPAPAPLARGFAALPMAPGKYAPVNPAAWQGGIDAVAPLLSKRAPGATTDMQIRTDGRFHALRITLAKPVKGPEELVPVFRSTVVFFEQTRQVKPAPEQVVVVSGDVSVVADKAAIMDLFLERLDEAAFVARLQRVGG